MDTVHRLKPTCIARVRIGESETLRDTIAVMSDWFAARFRHGDHLSHVPWTVMARSLLWLPLIGLAAATYLLYRL
jgi:hypothetical protein